MFENHQKALDRVNKEADKIYAQILNLPGIEKTNELLAKLDELHQRRQSIMDAMSEELAEHQKRISKEFQANHKKIMKMAKSI